MRNSNCAKVIIFVLCVLLSLPVCAQQASGKGGVTVRGIVSEVDKNDVYPLEYALIVFPDYGISVTSKEDGSYEIKNVPQGTTRVKVTYLGKLPIEETVEIKAGMKDLDFVLENENFRIKEVVISAQASQAGEATSSLIGRSAMDHMQATNLSDVMALLPGGLSDNPDMSENKNLTLRWVGRYNESQSDAQLANAMGTAIIRDGAPLSNNANLSAMNPTVAGGTAANAGGASPAGGIDIRSISTDNIESVEVIRGIPSVEHGDLTSGAVIINSKAGREPLRITAKANPNVYMGSIGTGFLLGRKRGAININGDYAINTNKPTVAYRTYRRASARVLYSNEFGPVRSNTSFNFIYGKNQQNENPDDETSHSKSRGEDYGFNLNTNGVWNINYGWLKSLRYVASGSYTSKQSFMQTAYTTASSPYSATTTDGAVLSNVAGRDLFDADGNKITNFGPEDQDSYAYYLPDAYVGRYYIDSREVNAFAKLVATLNKQFGYINNRMLIGASFKTDGNVGHGKTYDPTTPPYRNLSAKNATFRPRDYKDIPFINQASAFAEENFSWRLGLHELKLQAGVRYDHASRVGGVVSPRFNGSFEILPNKLFVRGGWGVTAKMPTLLYLYPERAYFEYVNMNELSNTQIDEADRILITTTKVYDVKSDNLKVAKNFKSEIGFDLKLGQTTMSVTAFEERLRNGYTLSEDFDTFKPFMYNVYKRNEEGNIALDGAYPVLSSFVKPGNHYFSTTRGVEFDINFGRINAINTSFLLNGAFLDSRDHDDSYNFYDNSNSGASSRNVVAVYDNNNGGWRKQRFSTALRVTHNLPTIGFVVTLTCEAIWKQSDWRTYGNDSIPVGYLALEDGAFHRFDAGRYQTTQDLIDDGKGFMLQNASHTNAIKESYNPYCRFNINVTKEIGDMLRVSFFANNMFRSYPRRESRRSPGSYKADFNKRFYFGIELALTL